MASFEFTFPEFVTACEKDELIKFFGKYFTALHESKKFTEQEIAKRKKVIVDALAKNLVHRSTHMDKMKFCFRELKNKVNLIN